MKVYVRKELKVREAGDEADSEKFCGISNTRFKDSNEKETSDLSTLNTHGFCSRREGEPVLQI